VSRPVRSGEIRSESIENVVLNQVDELLPPQFESLKHGKDFDNSSEGQSTRCCMAVCSRQVTSKKGLYAISTSMDAAAGCFNVQTKQELAKSH
jgi:hypothetical protein